MTKARGKGSATKTILVVLDLSYASSREQLSGIYRFQMKRSDWNIRLIPSNDPRFQPAIEQSLAEGVDGMIVKLGCALDVSTILAAHDVPLVLVERPDAEQLAASKLAHRSLAIVGIDNHKVGMLGANYLRSLGNFASAVYVHDPNDNEWSRQRGRAFVTAMRKHKLPAKFLTLTEFERRITVFPKPMAVFVAFDLLATNVVKTCQSTGLSVPQDVTILSVDNDQFLCENVRPTLSSIRLDLERQGFMAAESLDALMKGRRVRLERTLPPLDIIPRSSTTFLPPARVLVDRAVRLVESQAANGIRVTDIARQLGVSTSLVKIRFRQFRGHSLRDEMIATRLDKVKQLLQANNYTIGQIAKMCGFSSAVTLNHLFRKRFATCPSAWRDSHRLLSLQKIVPECVWRHAITPGQRRRMP